MAEDTGILLRGDVLVVCTANVCRSPLAAALLAEALPAATVSSAGIRAMTESPMCAVSASLLPAGAAPEHAARQLTAELVAGADLVLTMEREQRSAAVRLAPGSQNKVFTLREAVALAGGLTDRGAEPAMDVRALALAMHATRGLVVVPPAEPQRRRWWSRPVEPEDPLTVPDGHGQGDADHLAAVQQVSATVQQFVDALRVSLTPPEAHPALD